ncbi:hypothetical protein V5P93_003365 [Actinokineospora auranticolor]|uniref:Uncharacterized protein n=1 Tax=Actinokineospora auranticolor TaxID=155976 RepID=A0A2S6GPA9_9PSEU|nr:hypothetical protein [Actinokineospora auranticolor]PPK67026.1 hypothetical protein CLV40_10822 [Actinokineospora auranticolor]
MTPTTRPDAVAQRQLAPPVPEQGRSAAARPWRPYADGPLLTPAMALGPEHVPPGQMQAMRRYLGALVAIRNTPVHVNVAFNACYFGYDLTTGYAGAAMDPASFPTVALGQTIDALPVGALINVASGGDPIWAEVVYKEGAHPSLEDDGAVPSWLSGAPAGATGPAQTELHSQPVLHERLVLDLDVFGLAPTAAQIARLTRRGRFDEFGHLLVGSRYATVELAELDDTGFYRHYLLSAGRDLLFNTAAPTPLPLLLTEDAGPEHHQAALEGLFATVTAALRELDTVRIWQSYAVSRAGLSARLRSGDALGADDIASLASATARSALPDQSRRLGAARQVTYTALGSRLRCVNGSAIPMHGAGYANTVLHANLIFADYLRGDAEDGLLFDRVHLRLDDSWQGGGIWRAEAPGSAHALLDPTIPRGFGWAETLAPPAPPAAVEPPTPEPEPEDELAVSDSQISWTVALRAEHIDTGVLALPRPAAHMLVGDRRDGTCMRLLLNHDGHQLDVTDATQMATADLHGSPAVLSGVSWPMDFFPGILLTVTWPRNTATLRITSTLLDMPVTIDDELDIEHCYDPRIVTRDALDRTSGASATLAQRVLRAVRRLGLLEPDGVARLARDHLAQQVYGSSTEQTERAIDVVVAQLRERGTLTQVTGSRTAGGIAFPAVAGQPVVPLLCYTPTVVAGPTRPRRFTRLDARFVGTHAVTGFLRRIEHLGHSASPHARAAYREYRARHGLAGPAELPEGWTFVRPHERGS